MADPDASRVEAGFAAYFVEEVRKHLERTYGADRLYTDGLRVWTTLVPRYQRWLEEAAAEHMLTLEAEFDYPMTKARLRQPRRRGRAARDAWNTCSAPACCRTSAPAPSWP